jgi:hypothetical protein
MKQLYILVLILCVQTVVCFSQSSFDEKNTTQCNVRLNVTNVGTFGNSFRGYRDGSGRQSCEFPQGSGIEHIFEGGIWFGVDFNGEKFVSTSAFDAPQGYAPGRSGFEFTAEVGSQLQERSTLFDSPFYTPQAISHQDFVAKYSDKNDFVPGTGPPAIQIQNHINRQLKIDVIDESYNWNYSFANFFVIKNFYIINNSTNTYNDIYFGLWANTVVRNINLTPAGAGGAAFYNKGGNGYMDSLYMAYCYDHSGDVGFTNTYVAQKFLGAEDKFGFHHPALDSIFNKQNSQWELQKVKAHYNAWEFNNTSPSYPLLFFPSDDNQRYIKLSEGLNYNPCWTADNCQNPETIQQVLNKAGNRSDIVSVGPFQNFAPGDTINVTYAIVLARKLEDGIAYTENTLEQRKNLMDNSAWAQTAYNGEDINFNGILDPGEDKNGDGKITRYILPAPPDIPRTKVIAEENKIEIYWSDNSEFSIDPISQEMDFEGYRIYLTKFAFDVATTPPQLDFIPIAEYDIMGNNLFKDVGFKSVKLAQPKTFPDDTNVYIYKYEINNILNGWQYAVAVTAFDRGDPINNLESLESSILANDFRVFPGKKPNADIKASEPFVYPNPYYFGAAWEGVSPFQEQSRKLIFANIPQRCIIRIFTPAGDLIDEIYHDENYDGSDIRWFKTFGSENPDENVFSGGEHAWDLLSKDTQIISRGIYLFTVKDLENGNMQKGKFAIIK